MKKRLFAGVLSLMMICSLSINGLAQEVYAEAINDCDVAVEDTDIAETMHELNKDGQEVEIAIEPSIVDEIKGEDIEEVLCEGLGTADTFVEIVSEETIENEGLEAIQGDVAYVYTEDDELIGLTLPEDISQDDSDIVLDLINGEEVNNGDIVNIESIETADEIESGQDCDEEHDMTIDSELLDEADFSDYPENDEISPEGIVYKITTSKAKKKGSEYIAKNEFVTSVAKGQTKKLGYEFTGSVKTSIEAGACYSVASMKAGLEATVSVKIKAETTYSGKGMAAGKNSREFRVKYYKQKYTRTQTKTNKITGKKIGTKSATIAKPTRYAEYSIDRKVK